MQISRAKFKIFLAKITKNLYISPLFQAGGVAEWFNATVLKTVDGLRHP